MLAALETIGYTPLVRAVEAQREEWERARAVAPNSPTAKEWDWAMSTVRSRTFSGPYTPGTFLGALAQLFGASTLALGYALVSGGAGAADTAFDFFSGAVVFVLMNEFVFGPRFTKAKRYVLCPWIDLLNHDGTLGGSDIAYEYFKDAFSVRVDPEGPDTPVGGQMLISYGSRSNDVLLRYYGFAEAGNVHDVYELEQEDLILKIDKVRPLPAGALPALKAAGLVDASRVVALTPQGADEVALRLARLLTHPELAARADSGREVLSEAAAEAEAKRALAAVATDLHKNLGGGDVAAGVKDADVASVLEAFVEEKRRVLLASAAALGGAH